MRVTETRKRWLPRLSLVGQTQWNNAEGFGGQNVTSVLMLTVTQQLWDGGNSSIDRQEMLGTVRMLSLQRDQQRARIDAEVRGAREQLKLAHQDVAATQQVVKVAELAVNAARKGLEAGSNTRLELLNQEDRLADARLSLLQASLSVEGAKLALRQALGLPPLP